MRDGLDEQYRALLALFEAHLIEHPYLLGGHPSAADYAVMGAMHAHLGRDPARLRVMQDNAPRTFRWVEHMLVPEVVSPEFFSREVEYELHDQVAVTALMILQRLVDWYGESFVLDGMAFNQAMDRLGATIGFELNPEQDQPQLGAEKVLHHGQEYEHRANLYAVWLEQRAQCCFQGLSLDVQDELLTSFSHQGIAEFLQVPTSYRIQRQENRLIIGGVA